MGLRMAISVTVLLFSPVLACAQEKVPKPNRVPADVTPEQRELIRQGTVAHDAGQYDAAIADYKQVLEKAPDNISAMYDSRLPIS